LLFSQNYVLHIHIYMNRIKEVLTEKGVKQTWLADKLGKSFNMVNAYVQNRRQPSLEVLYKIAGLLNVEAKDLLVTNNKVETSGEKKK
jgi:transcriptional regulator with XRE-family HTH domain